MTLSIRLDGVEYIDFVEASVDRDMEAAASTFSFSATASASKYIPIREGDKVTIYADDTKILTGWVDEYSIKYDSEDHKINIKGRSLTQDLIDCSAPFVEDYGLKGIGLTQQIVDTYAPFLNDYDSIDLFTLCKQVASNFDITVLNKTTDSDVLKPFEDILGSDLGQSAFDFLESFARVRQVLLTDDADGNLILTRASKELSPSLLVNLVNGISNNIKSAERKINLSNLYNTYTANTQGYPIDDQYDSILELSEDAGFAVDNEIRKSRKYEFYTEETTENFSLTDRAIWEASIRRARNFSYIATVQGHSLQGIVWEPNKLHSIVDEFCGMNDQFLCNKVSYRYSLDSGSESILTFTTKNAYTLQSELDKIILDEEYF